MKQTEKTKKTLLVLVISLTLCLAGLLTATYAWLSASDHMGEANLQILQIDSRIRVFTAKDVNYNGVPDLLITNGQELDCFENPNTLGEGESATIGYVHYTGIKALRDITVTPALMRSWFQP